MWKLSSKKESKVRQDRDNCRFARKFARIESGIQ